MIGISFSVAEWMRDADCATLSPEDADRLFFPPNGVITLETAYLCDHCPVKVECREYAVKHSGGEGIWAGEYPPRAVEEPAKPAPVNAGNAKWAKVNVTQVIEIRARVQAGETQVAVAADYGISNAAVWKIVNRVRWKNIPDAA